MLHPEASYGMDVLANNGKGKGGWTLDLSD